jgi:hypothetical protein
MRIMIDDVIDMWAPIWPTAELTENGAERFPEEMLGYLRVFFKRPPTLEAVDGLFEGVRLPDEAIVAELRRAGITRSLVTGFYERSFVGKTFVSNDRVARVAERFGDRVVPFCGADVGRGMAAVRELQRFVEQGFRGLSLRPFMTGLPADDRRYYPFYAKCVELDIPVSVHSSANWSAQRSNELGHPRHLEVVANDFPELKIIVSHGGYPWVLEACLLAWKHENVYLELAAHRPKYIARPGTGWEPLLRFGPQQLRKKVLYGTGWFLLGVPPSVLVEEMRALPLPADVLADWLGGNAARLLGLASTPR